MLIIKQRRFNHNSNFRKENNVTILQKTSYLTSEDKEIEFLKKISEIVVIMLLPRGYSISPLKDLLCEIIAFKGKIMKHEQLIQIIINLKSYFSVSFNNQNDNKSRFHKSEDS